MQARVDRHQVVARRDLQAVPGIEEYGHVGLLQRAGEVAHLAVEATLVRSRPRITSKPTSFRATAMSLASLIGLVSDTGLHVGRVADDQGDPFLRRCGHRKQQGDEDGCTEVMAACQWNL